MRLEIEGDPNQHEKWVGYTGCPASGEETKSIFCPKRDQCELLTIVVRAETSEEAATFIEYAEVTDQIPNCLNGKPFLTKMFGNPLRIQPTI